MAHDLQFIWAKLNFNGKAKIRCFKKIARMLDNGLSIQKSVQSLRARALRKGRNDPVALVLDRVLQGMRSGLSFARSWNGLLPIPEVMLLDAGEQSGHLSDALGSVILITEARLKTIGGLVKALAYPVLLMGMFAGSLTMLSTQVMPILLQALPQVEWKGMAGLLISVSSFINSSGSLILLGLLLLLALGATLSMRHLTGPVRVFLDRLPPWNFYRLLVGGSWLLSTSSLVRAGVKVTEAVDAMRKMSKPVGLGTGNRWLYERLDLLLFQLNRGHSLGLALEETGMNFPDREIVDDLVTYSVLGDFETTLHNLGREWIIEGVEKIETMAKILNIVLVVLLGCFLVLFALGFVGIQQSMTSGLGAMSGLR